MNARVTSFLRHSAHTSGLRFCILLLLLLLHFHLVGLFPVSHLLLMRPHLGHHFHTIHHFHMASFLFSFHLFHLHFLGFFHGHILLFHQSFLLLHLHLKEFLLFFKSSIFLFNLHVLLCCSLIKLRFFLHSHNLWIRWWRRRLLHKSSYIRLFLSFKGSFGGFHYIDRTQGEQL